MRGTDNEREAVLSLDVSTFDKRPVPIFVKMEGIIIVVGDVGD
jgi:hypothetical protein